MTRTTSDSEQDKTAKQQKQQQKPQNVDKVAPGKLHLVGDGEKIDYDVEQLNAFIDVVFHTDRDAGHRLVYSKTGFPVSTGVEGLNKTLSRTTKPRALYFCASTCRRADDGKLYHRKELFEAFHVLVLDDVGTKIDPATLPEGLEPTYVIESSEGNFQWGFVLEEPLTDYDHASALIQAFALAGMTDKGGAMPCKLVRLPGGVNGKNDDEKRNFRVKLHDMDGPYWTPKALLNRLNLEIDNEQVTWDGIENGTVRPFAKKYKTDYMPLQPTAQNSDGSVDPVLEWLYTNDIVLADSGGEWVDIRCPWCESHTTGNDAAGYTPIGRGLTLTCVLSNAFTSTAPTTARQSFCCT